MARIGTAREHVGIARDGNPDALVVTVVAPGLQSSRIVSSPDGGADLMAYVRGLERSWRGWDGERVWRSCDDDVVITTRHPGDRVVLTVRLGRSVTDPRPGWSVEVEIGLGAGEQLSVIAADLALELTR